MLLSRKQLKVFIIVATIISAPFYLLAILSPVCGEGGMLFLLHALAGLPWIIIYHFVHIPGFSGPQTGSGSYCFGLVNTFLVYLPIYLNLYLLIKIAVKKNSAQ